MADTTPRADARAEAALAEAIRERDTYKAADEAMQQANYELHQRIRELESALAAPSPPEGVDALRLLYDAASKGFHTAESCGPDRKYWHVSKFQSLDDLQDFHRAWTVAMVSVRDAALSAPPATPPADARAVLAKQADDLRSRCGYLWEMLNEASCLLSDVELMRKVFKDDLIPWARQNMHDARKLTAAIAAKEQAEAALEALRGRCEALAEEYAGCGDHSRHKQAVEVWHHVARELRGIVGGAEVGS